MVRFDRPVKISAGHELTRFDCGEEVLNLWLRHTALKNQDAGASATYVVCEQGTRVVAGYFCLSAASIMRSAAPGGVARNQPDPIPAMLLGRLAVDQKHTGAGMGRSLFAEAYQISLEAAALVGIRALLVHALNEESKGFWRQLGFSVSPTDPLTLMLKLSR